MIMALSHCYLLINSMYLRTDRCVAVGLRSLAACALMCSVGERIGLVKLLHLCYRYMYFSVSAYIFCLNSIQSISVSFVSIAIMQLSHSNS